MLEISDLGSIEELYYPCSENKGADQLRHVCGYREAVLRLCSAYAKCGFLIAGLYYFFYSFVKLI